jgi:hypothetical protein
MGHQAHVNRYGATALKRRASTISSLRDSAEIQNESLPSNETAYEPSDSPELFMKVSLLIWAVAAELQPS